MAWRFKASKYKNAAPIVPKPEACIRDIFVGSYQTYGNNIAASAAFMAFNVDHNGNFFLFYKILSQQFFYFPKLFCKDFFLFCCCCFVQDLVWQYYLLRTVGEKAKRCHCCMHTLTPSPIWTFHRFTMGYLPLDLKTVLYDSNF